MELVRGEVRGQPCAIDLRRNNFRKYNQAESGCAQGVKRELKLNIWRLLEGNGHGKHYIGMGSKGFRVFLLGGFLGISHTGDTGVHQGLIRIWRERNKGNSFARTIIRSDRYWDRDFKQAVAIYLGETN